MKKYLIISIGSIIGSLVIIFQIYKNSDIELIDSIVESTVTGLGIKSEVVAKKIERKVEEKRIIEEKKQIELSVSKLTIDPDEQIEVPEPEVKDEAETFNKVESKKQTTVVKEIDSANFNMKSVVKEEEEEVNPFNTFQTVSSTSSAEAVPTRFFKARIHNTQELMNDQLIWVRADEPVIINGISVAKNTRFQARVNMFNGRITLLVDDINGNAVTLTNYDEQKKKGVPVIERYQQGDKIVLSDGEPMTFNAY